MQSQIVNLTPHPIVIKGYDGKENITFKSDISKWVPLPRVSSSEEITGNLNGIDVAEVIYGEIENLPDEKEGTFLIVSGFVLAAAKTLFPDRNDLIAPNTGKAFRDENGRIIGVPGFIM